MGKFIHETEVYNILKAHGIDVVRHLSVKSNNDLLSQKIFADGEKIVIKGIADNLWHKSDEGALFFETFSKELVSKISSEMKSRIADKYSWIETLICEKIAFIKKDNLPTELFLSIKKDEACGQIINVSLGGINTEMWSNEVGIPLLMWPVATMTPEAAILEFKKHLAGKIWLGGIRQNSGLVSESTVLAFFQKLWKVASYMEKNRIELIEVNPVAISEDGRILPLDGVGVYGEDSLESVPDLLPENLKAKLLFSPEKIAIAGVSKKKDSFGNKIFANLLNSKIKKSDIKIIRPDGGELEGVECFSHVSALKLSPVDVLILALPATQTVKTIFDLCEQGGGAEIVYIVAGGIGDSADSSNLGKQIRVFLNERRKMKKWAPAIIGPNSLGIILSPLNLSTLFISQKKLPVSFAGGVDSNVGLISQSGAFFITRLSNELDFPIKYGLCVGNQLDLSISQIARAMFLDEAIDVVGLYVEGFKSGEVFRLVKLAEELVQKNRHLVLYKAGRSADGMKAAAGHTGAMAGDYELHKAILERAGIKVVETFSDFINLIKWLGIYSDAKQINSVAVISNAGYESVASADALGDNKTLFALDVATTARLTASVKSNNLEGLGSPANPLDVTPMADENGYLAFISDFAQAESVDLIVTGVVPLTDRLETFEHQASNSKASVFAQTIKQLSDKFNKKIAVVVDSGILYDDYRQLFQRAKIPTFKSTQELYACLKFLVGKVK